MKVLKEVPKKDYLLDSEVTEQHIIILQHIIKSNLYILTAQRFRSDLYDALTLDNTFTINNKLTYGPRSLKEWIKCIGEGYNVYAFNNMKEAIKFLNTKFQNENK
ncbi:MAG: hypothetical protein ACOCV1_04070 [Bacillota bacterium]